MIAIYSWLGEMIRICEVSGFKCTAYQVTFGLMLMNFDPIEGYGWSGQSCQVVGDYLYVFGGVGYVGGTLDIIFKYHATDKWTKISPSLPHTQEKGVALHYDHTPFIYIIGGANDNQIWYSIFQFDVNTDTITHTYTMATPLWGLTAAIIRPKLYIFSGIPNDPT
eukprot:96121_1